VVSGRTLSGDGCTHKLGLPLLFGHAAIVCSRCCDNGKAKVCGLLVERKEIGGHAEFDSMTIEELKAYLRDAEKPQDNVETDETNSASGI
jgi:hypothetical protein